MKIYIIILGLTQILSCASTGTTKHHSGIHPNDVRIANSIDKNNCKFIKQQTCSSKRRNGIARCQQWHKKRAAKSGANYAVLITSSSDSRPFISGGQIFTASNASLTADYYLCGSITGTKGK